MRSQSRRASSPKRSVPNARPAITSGAAAATQQVEPEREVQINPPGRDRAGCDAEQVGGAEAPGDHVLELQVLRYADRFHDQAATAVATAVATVRTVATVPCTTGLWLSL